jgi:predicted deacylase
MPRMSTTVHLNGLDVPAFKVQGAEDGPSLSLIGGIHGCEYSSIAAVTRVMRELDATQLSGSITAVPVVSMESFIQRSAFFVPADGKNLNRAFPGDPAGTYTEKLAHDIFTTLIEPADVLIDLHGGDLVEALEPFALYCNEASRALALAFGLPYVVDSTDALPGMTASVAKRGVIAEAGGAGQLEEHAVQQLTNGVGNVLRYLDMLPGELEPQQKPTTIARFEWLYSTPAGFWVAETKAGDRVERNAKLGEIRDLYGDVQEQIRAPADGVVLFLTTSAAVAQNGLLLGLGCER